MTIYSNRRLAILASLAFLWEAVSGPVVAKADTQQSSDPATQVAGMFMQTCVRFAGNKDKLRSFLSEKKVKAVDESVAKYFLTDGRSGVVYDTSNQFSRMGLVSHDDGTCDAFSWNVDGEKAVVAVEGFLKSSNIEYKLTDDQRDSRASELRHRHYDLASGSRKWFVVLSTSSSEGRLHAIFTASPRN